MTTPTYLRAFISNQLKPDTAFHFVPERDISRITAAKIKDQHGQVVDGYLLNMRDTQALYTLSLQTFTLNEVEAEIERGNRLGRAPEAPIT